MSELAEETAKAVPDLKKLNSLRRGFLLSNLGGRIRDIGSNATLGLFNALADVPAAGLDIVLSGATGSQRTRFLKGSVSQQAKGFAEGARNVSADLGVPTFLRELRRSKNLPDAIRRLPAATRQAWERLLTLPQEGRFFEGPIAQFKNPLSNALVRLPIKATTVSDRLFAPAAFRRSVNNAARSEADALVRQGRITREQGEQEVRRILANVPGDLAPSSDEARDAVQAMLANIPEGIRARALIDAKVATYINENTMSRLIDKMGEADPRIVPIIDFLFPFRRAGYNVAARAAEFSPAGLAKGVLVDGFNYLRTLGKQSLPQAQQKLVDQLGKGSLGTAAFYFGYLNRDRITPQYATVTETGRRLLRQAGEPFGGARIPEMEVAGLTLPGTGQTITIEKLGPLGPIVEWGAELGREQDRREEEDLQTILDDVPPEERANAIVQSLFSGAKIALSSLPTRTPQDVLGTFKGSTSKQLERFASREIASLAVPQFFATTAQAIDPTLREAEGDGGFLAETGRRIQSRIPGLSSALPARQDVFGEDEQRKGGLGAVLSPVQARRPRTATDPIRAELERVGFGLAPGFRQGAARETPEQLQLLGRLGGAEVRAQLEKAIQSDAYRAIPDRIRRELPNADPATAERVARIKQREILENVVRRTRTRERKKFDPETLNRLLIEQSMGVPPTP